MLTDHGIHTPTGATGQIRMQCPQCSQTRHKHYEKCLTVNVEDQTWYCHHCGFKTPNGGNKYKLPVYEEPKLPQAVIDWFAKGG